MGGFGLQYPHINTPVEVQQQQATLGDILAQRQQRQQQVQENAIKLQQIQQQQQDEQALTNHIRQTLSSGGTIDNALQTAEQNGVSATAAAKARDLHAQIKDRYASADKTQLANQLAQNDMVSADLLPIRTMQDPGMKAAQWSRARQNAIAKGLIKPDDPSIPETYPGDQAYEAAMAHLQGAKEYIDYGLKAQDAADKHVAAQNTAKVADMDIVGRTVPSLATQDPDMAQANWDKYRSTLSPTQKALIPEQYSPDAEKQARQQAMTVPQQASEQRQNAELQNAQARLLAEGITSDDIAAATDPKASPEQRRAAADAIVKRKGDAAVQQEIAKQLGVVTALLGGTVSPVSGQTPGAVTVPPATGVVQIPKEAPGQPGITQLAAKNNNPGNLRFQAQPGAKPGAGGYAAFPTPEAGYAALQNQISIDTKKGLTLQQYITKYAPPSENDTAGYLARAAQALGVDPKTPLSQIDANKLAQFQAKQESSSMINGTPTAPPANGRNESVLDDAVKAGKISQGTANEIRAVADGAPYWPERSGALGMANQVKENLLGQYAPDYKPGEPAPIKEGSPEFKVAQDMAYGKLTMGQFRSLYAYSRDSNKKQAIYQKASELNPNFNPAAFELGYTLAKNPKVQQQLASLDNVVRGVPDLLRVSDAATRTGIPLLNKFVLPGGVALGSKNYSNLQTARTAFADELSGALGYGSATDMSREMGFNMTDPNLSPATFKSNVQDILIPFVERKRATLLNQMGIYGQPRMNPAASAPNPGGGGGGNAKPPKGHLIEVNGRRYAYSGDGDSTDLKNYSEVKK